MLCPQIKKKKYSQISIARSFSEIVVYQLMLLQKKIEIYVQIKKLVLLSFWPFRRTCHQTL